MADYGISLSLESGELDITTEPLMWVVDSFVITSTNSSGSKTYDARLAGALRATSVHSGNVESWGDECSAYSLVVDENKVTWNFGSVANLGVANNSYTVIIWYKSV